MPITAYQVPGVYMEEVSTGAKPIQPVGLSIAAFLGIAPNANAYVNQAVPVDSLSKFTKLFIPQDAPFSNVFSLAVKGFFDNGGQQCYIVNLGPDGNLAGTDSPRTGIKVLEEIDEISIVAAPGLTGPAVFDALLTHCATCRYRMPILDYPVEVGSNLELIKKVATLPAPDAQRALPPAGGKTSSKSRGDSGDGDLAKTTSADLAKNGSADSKNANGEPEPNGYRPPNSKLGRGTVYFPSLRVSDPYAPNQYPLIPPSGHMAGIWSRTDTLRGVQKAPANETVYGALGLGYGLTDAEQAQLNPLGINCIRRFEGGIMVWGARTIADGSSDMRYLNVRRLMDMLEKSILKSTSWIVFEPNTESLWKRVRHSVSDFLMRVWRDGALMGATPEEAFFVKCDRETNPPEEVDAGVLTILVGVAPVKPAEFVVFRIGQTASGPQIGLNT
jgi:uncharacterized protein